MVVTEIKKAWPVDEEIPSFRPHHVDQVVKLNNFVKRLSEGKDSSKYVFPQCAFGANAIREMVMGHMRERRRGLKDSEIQKGATSEKNSSNGDTESVEDSSSSSSSSPPPSQAPSTKKVKMYADYFHPG